MTDLFKIAELGLDKVVFCGDVADEILGGYRGFGLTNSPEEFGRENLCMLSNVHFFDLLRCEKSFAGHGLEARVPFADKDVLQAVMRFPPEVKMWGKSNGRI